MTYPDHDDDPAHIHLMSARFEIDCSVLSGYSDWRGPSITGLFSLNHSILHRLWELAFHTLDEFPDGPNSVDYNTNVTDDLALTASTPGSDANRRLRYSNDGGILTVSPQYNIAVSFPPKRSDAATLTVAFLLFKNVPISTHSQILLHDRRSKAPNQPPPRPPPDPYPTSTHLLSFAEPSTTSSDAETVSHSAAAELFKDTGCGRNVDTMSARMETTPR
jgi:hypothetical protein